LARHTSNDNSSSPKFIPQENPRFGFGDLWAT
jgi:hypothetical protein